MNMLFRRVWPALLIGCCGYAQVIEFESGGLHYQTLTRNGVTVMWAKLPVQLREYTIFQVAVSNGSPVSWTIKPEDFSFQRKDGTVVPAVPARTVVNDFMTRGGRSDVIKLVTLYEQGLYGMTRFRSTNGYEVRRQAALAEVSSTRLKSAAAASAIVFVQTKLAPGQSTDGAIFFSYPGHSLTPGKLIVRTAGEVFEFDAPD